MHDVVSNTSVFDSSLPYQKYEHVAHGDHRTRPHVEKLLASRCSILVSNAVSDKLSIWVNFPRTGIWCSERPLTGNENGDRVTMILSLE